MELQLTKINGTNFHLNYGLLVDSIKNQIGNTCSKAELIVLNNFPVAVSAQANIDFILLLRLPEIHNSYYKVYLEEDHFYIHNLIIAVSVINDYETESLKISNEQLETNSSIFNLDSEASKLKWGLTNYLASACGLQRNFITVNPVFWIRNSTYTGVTKGTVISKELTFDLLEKCIKINYYSKYHGYRPWRDHEINFENDVRRIFEQASKDSATGYITRKKLERIQQKFDQSSLNAYDQIGDKLVEVKGKAGTGKTSNLLHWMLHQCLNKRRGLFLTYNHLLVFDISQEIKSFRNQLPFSQSGTMASASTDTIHGFFFNVAKKLGVLRLMSEKRIMELKGQLDQRWVRIEQYFNAVRNTEPNISVNKLLMYVQSKFEADEGTKREAIDFIQHLQRERIKFLGTQQVTQCLFEGFREHKVSLLENLINSEVFLKDYNQVLSEILSVATNLDGFLKGFDVVKKYDLLSGVMNLDSNILLEDNSGMMDYVKIKQRYKKGINGFRAGRIVFIDEAQDCFKYERDIIYQIFGHQNVVVANGDKEQLIRYSELCDWQVSRAQSIDYYRYTKKRQSFRMKPAIAALANHIAKTYGIDLEVTPIETEDHGTVIVNRSPNIENEIRHMHTLISRGERIGCTPYESLLLMKPSEVSTTGDEKDGGATVMINEFNNVIETNDFSGRRKDWELIKKVDSQARDFRIWNATGNIDKRELSTPGKLSVRAIYYESCRGLEAWSTMCFGLDDFFIKKSKTKVADDFLLNDLFDQLTPEKRREMYAATWVLMAITRAIENCYIEISNPGCSMYHCIVDFAKRYPHFVSSN